MNHSPAPGRAYRATVRSLAASLVADIRLRRLIYPHWRGDEGELRLLARLRVLRREHSQACAACGAPTL